MLIATRYLKQKLLIRWVMGFDSIVVTSTRPFNVCICLHAFAWKVCSKLSNSSASWWTGTRLTWYLINSAHQRDFTKTQGTGIPLSPRNLFRALDGSSSPVPQPTSSGASSWPVKAITARKFSVIARNHVLVKPNGSGFSVRLSISAVFSWTSTQQRLDDILMLAVIANCFEAWVNEGGSKCSKTNASQTWSWSIICVLYGRLKLLQPFSTCECRASTTLLWCNYSLKILCWPMLCMPIFCSRCQLWANCRFPFWACSAWRKCIMVYWIKMNKAYWLHSDNCFADNCL